MLSSCMCEECACKKRVKPACKNDQKINQDSVQRSEIVYKLPGYIILKPCHCFVIIDRYCPPWELLTLNGYLINGNWNTRDRPLIRVNNLKLHVSRLSSSQRAQRNWLTFPLKIQIKKMEGWKKEHLAEKLTLKCKYYSVMAESQPGGSLLIMWQHKENIPYAPLLRHHFWNGKMVWYGMVTGKNGSMSIPVLVRYLISTSDVALEDRDALL